MKEKILNRLKFFWKQKKTILISILNCAKIKYVIVQKNFPGLYFFKEKI